VYLAIAGDEIVTDLSGRSLNIFIAWCNQTLV